MANHLPNLIAFNPKNCMLGCMAHVINLAAQAGIKAFSRQPPLPALPGGLSSILNNQPDQLNISSIITCISGFTTFLNRSPQKASPFLEITNGTIGKRLAMVQDVATRWNSTFFMLRRAFKLRACITVFCETNNLTNKYSLTLDEWAKVKQLCSFLELLNKATEIVLPDKTTSLVLAAPVYIRLIERLNEACRTYNAQEMIPSARDMIDKLESYFYAAIEKPVYLCLMILDPRVKATLLTPEVLQLLRLSKESIIQTFKNEAKQFTNKRGENNPEKNRETKPITQDTMAPIINEFFAIS
ncbi:hypothetical protein PCANC_15274 [Puccinia coronata f. sp. avenae]|uniref:hAT-like transposase RNase-H fold domain-containing protein n=1 Tax=Puccinia coronata f. sp. avenae TaxID=200324 RepID=A0A2N5UIK5_9BASI|nr:hypothetical protein PCANC_15274 [Puccinia coronata f. sp. avenae]